MGQELIEETQLRVMTVTEAQLEHYKSELARIQAEGPRILAGIKSKEGVERGATWRVQVRDFIRSVETGALGIASALLHRRKKEIDAEMDRYIDPCEKLFKDVKTKMDKWYIEEAQRVRIANEKARAKDLAKAEENQQQKVQTLMDLGKPKAAMAAAQRPLIVTPPTIVMPKIKNAIWKKKFIVQIDELGPLLQYIGKNPKYHKMIKVEELVVKLESLAAEMDGNMKEFPGIQCFETPNSVSVGGPK